MNRPSRLTVLRTGSLRRARGGWIGAAGRRPVGVKLLVVLLILLAVNALGGGALLIADPSGGLLGMPVSLLAGSPFRDYLLPGVVLFSLLGVVPLAIVAGVWFRPRWAYLPRLGTHVAWLAAAGIGAALIVWILVQMTILRFFLQPLLLGLGVAIVAVSLLPSVRRHYGQAGTGAPRAVPRVERQRRDTSRLRGLTFRSLLPFFAWTFALSWGTGMAYVLFQSQVEALFGPMRYTNPVFILMVYSPGIVGALMVWRHHGLKGLAGFFRRFTLWRMPVVWWLLLLLGVPAVYYAGAALAGAPAALVPFTTWRLALAALLPMLLIGPIEEIGWRGVALPLLQRRFAPLGAALILGVTIALWHTPSFLLSGTKQSAWAYWPFFFGIVAVSVILTAMFNASRGSLLVAFLFHAQLNAPMWPDAQPWDMWLFVALAVIVAVAHRKALLDRGVTEVLMSADHEQRAVNDSAGAAGARKGRRVSAAEPTRIGSHGADARPQADGPPASQGDDAA